MNFAVNNRIFDSKIAKAVILLLLTALGLLSMSGKVNAAPPIPQYTLPNAGDFSQGGDVYMIVANRGNGFTLDAPTSVVRVYTPNRKGKLTLIDGAHCPNTGGPDRGANESEATTRYYVYALAADFPVNNNSPFDPGNRVLIRPAFESSSTNCNAYTFDYEIPAGIPPHKVDPNDGTPYDGLFGIEFIAAIDPGAPGWNMFKLQMGGSPRTPGRISYYAGSGDKFGLKADSSTPTNPGNFRLGFAANCNLKRGVPITKPLKWFDADVGETNQPGPLTSKLYEYDWNGKLTNTIDINITGHDNQAGQQSVTILGHHKYEWVINGIYTGNGWQFELPFDSYNTLINFNTDCPNPTPNGSCTANGVTNATINNLNPGQTGISITWTFTNRGTKDWTPTDSPLTQYRRTVNGSSFSPVTVPRVVGPGQSFSITTSETAPPSTGPIPKQISYTMWQSGAGSFGTPCSAKLYLKGPPPTSGVNFNLSCKNTYIAFTGSPPTTATYTTTTTTQPASYETYIDPTKWGLYPYPPGPPAATPPYVGPHYTYDPPATTVTTTHPADIIPIRLTFTGEDGSKNVLTYDKGGLTSGNGYSVDWDTFNRFGFMWPHLSYSVTLEAQTKGDLGNNENGPYSYNITTSTILPGDCLKGIACIGPSADPGPVQPGQRYDFTYAIQFNNQTNKPFLRDSSGYNFSAYTSGGLDYIGPDPAESSPIELGNGTPVIVKIPVRVNYKGNFGAIFRFKNDQLALDVGDGSCGLPGGPGTPGSDTPATLPYFQAWAGDISAGGGFRSVSNSCAGGSDPPYVWPGMGGGDQNSGGIRAFGIRDRNRGSRADFGVLALGVITGAKSCPVGAFSGSNSFGKDIIFANKNVSIGIGGYLNSNSDGHCVDDYFSNTRTGTSTPSSSGDLQADFDSCPQEPSNNSYRCQYQSGDLTIDGARLPAGRQITLYVDGDVTITGDIRYPDSFDPTSELNVPYFALIVRGNIILDDSVSRLDGLYVAQPNGNSKGKFITCNTDICTNQLVVNGSVIAQHLQLLRVHGNLEPLENGDVNGIGDNPAEIINFVPSMVIGIPAFLPYENLPENIFSLPPVF